MDNNAIRNCCSVTGTKLSPSVCYASFLTLLLNDISVKTVVRLAVIVPHFGQLNHGKQYQKLHAVQLFYVCGNKLYIRHKETNYLTSHHLFVTKWLIFLEYHQLMLNANL